MLQIIIFSYNRPLQLDALLNSILLKWQALQYKSIVLYNTSDDFYEKGYDILKNKYLQFIFVKETNGKYNYPLKDYFSFFNLKKMIKHAYCRSQRSDFRNLLNHIIKETSCKYIMFLTDDSIFIENVFIPNNLFELIDQNPMQKSISLRLGITMNNPPPSIKLENGVIQWNFNRHRKHKNWGYPFSVDGHIYSKELIDELANKIIYTNPSTLEGHICDYVSRNKLMNQGIALEHPYLLSFPINMVQSTVNNESLGISTELLNQYFLNGYKLNYTIPKKIRTFQQYPEYLILLKGTYRKTLKLIE